MKKNTLYTLTTVAAITALSVVAPIATQAVESTQTDGTVGFNPDGNYDDMPVVKPGTDEEIKPENPINTKPVANDVVLSYAPNFNFGTNNKISLSSGSTEYQSRNNTFQKENDTTKDYEIPQFVQVADASGQNHRNWSVTVQQADLFKEPDNSKLTNSRIRIKGQTVTNNLITTSVTDAIVGVNIPQTDPKYAQIPVNGAEGGTLEVLKSTGDTTKPAASTNGTKSSIIFKNGYVESDYNTETAAKEDINKRGVNADVVLSVPQSDKVLKKTYTAKLTWTIASTPNP